MSVEKTEAVLKIDGKEIPLEYQQILSLSSSKEVNRIPTARIAIKDGEVSTQDFKISNQNYFIPGAKIEILLGTPQQKDVVFKGVVIKHCIKVRKEKPSVLIVECKDESIRLSIGRKSRFFSSISDSDIFQEIVKEYNQLSIETQDSSQAIVHSQITQYYTTDWDFMSMRAEAIGHYLFVSDNKISTSLPDLKKSPVLKLAYGEPFDTKERSRIWEFESEMDARNQFENITTSSWDFSKQVIAEGSNNLTIEEQGNHSSTKLAEVIGLVNYQMHHLGKMAEGELNAFANAIKQKSLLNKVYGRIKFDGRADILPGDIVELEGVGDRFNGRVFVSRVHHSFEPGRWFTEIKFGLPYTWFYQKQDISNPPAMGLLPKIEGLQIGKVVQLKDEEDADKDFRIKITIPGFHKDEEGIWARLSSLMASNEKGLLFLPNIGDEVVIGYIGQDAREPIILGSLYSENAPPPLENDDNNYQKGIITNNNHKILIDEEKNTLTLETAGGSKVHLDDGDNKLVLSKGPSTIKITDTGIQIKALKIELDALTKIDIKAKGVTNINSPSGGLVKLGNGVTPVAGVATPVSIVPPAILQGPNTRVLV